MLPERISTLFGIPFVVLMVKAGMLSMFRPLGLVRPRLIAPVPISAPETLPLMRELFVSNAASAILYELQELSAEIL